MHTGVPVYSPPSSNFRGAEVASTNNHNRTKCTRSSLLRQAFRFTPPPQRGNISSSICSQWSKYQEAQNAHTQNADKRSALLRPPNAATLAAQWPKKRDWNPTSGGNWEKRTHAKCTQAFRFTPAFWFHHFRGAEVYTRKMHTSVPVYSRPLMPQLSQRYTRAKRTRAKGTLAFRFITSACWFHNFRTLSLDL